MNLIQSSQGQNPKTLDPFPDSPHLSPFISDDSGEADILNNFFFPISQPLEPFLFIIILQ